MASIVAKVLCGEIRPRRAIQPSERFPTAIQKVLFSRPEGAVHISESNFLAVRKVPFTCLTRAFFVFKVGLEVCITPYNQAISRASP